MVRNQKSEYVSHTVFLKQASHVHTDANDSSVPLCEFEVWRDQTEDLDDGCRDRHEHHRPFDTPAIRALEKHDQLRRPRNQLVIAYS
jgi:hypothetical protein